MSSKKFFAWLVALVAAVMPALAAPAFSLVSANPDGTLRGPTNFLGTNWIVRGTLFTNVAQMLASLGLPDKSVVTVSGYYTANDGGGGQFLYDASGSSTTNLGHCFAYGTGRLIRLREVGTVNVCEWGAKGDGSTDSTAALQAAIDNAADGTVYFPSGTFITTGLTAKRGITLQGASAWNTVLKMKSGSTGWIITWDGNAASAQLDPETNLVPTTVRDLYIDGNNRQADTGGILLRYADYFHLENVFIWKCSRSAVFLDKSVRESVFDRVNVRYCGNKDATDNNGGGWPAFSVVDWETSSASAEDKHNGIVLRGCEVVFSLGDAIAVDTRQISASGRRVSNVLVDHCWIHGWNSGFTSVTYWSTINASATMQAYDLVKVGAAYNVRITDNTISFSGKGKPGVNLTASVAGGSPITGITYNPELVRVSGNYINGSWDSSTTGRTGVSAEYGSGIVTDNQVDLYFPTRTTLGASFIPLADDAGMADRGIAFDGTTAGSYVAVPMQAIGSGDFTVHTRVRLPSTLPANTAGIWTLSSAQGGVAVQGIGCFLESSGALRVLLYGPTGSDTRQATVNYAYLQNFMGQVVDLVVVRSGTTLRVLLNGGELVTTTSTGGSAPAWNYAITSTYFNLGVFTSSQIWNSTIMQARVANRALATTEIQDLCKRGPHPSDQWGSQTTLSSGLLSIGKRYRIVTFTDGSWTSAGAANNNPGTEFVATTTGSGLLDAGDTAVEIGWIADVDCADPRSATVVDRSSNRLHGTLAGNVVGSGPSSAVQAFELNASRNLNLIDYSTLLAMKFNADGDGLPNDTGFTFQKTTTQSRLTLGQYTGVAAPLIAIVEGDHASGVNAPGGILLLSAGKGTGTNITAGYILFDTPDTTVDGSGAQTQTAKLTLKQPGQLGFTPRSTAPTSQNGDGDLYYDSTEAAFRAQISGGYKNLRAGKLRKATATLDFPSTAAQSESTLTVTVTGAVVGDVVYLGVPAAATTANSCYTAWVSATDTISIRFSNYGPSLARDPFSGVFTVAVEQY